MPLTAPTAPLFITDREAAALLSIGRATLARLRASGRFGPPAIRLGRSVRFDREEVISWAQAGAPTAAIWRAMREQQDRRSARAQSSKNDAARVSARAGGSLE
jgi:excisionase family DNA binding protein